MNAQSRQITIPPFSNAEIIKTANTLTREYLDIIDLKYFLRHGYQFYDVFNRVIYPNYGIKVIENCNLNHDSTGAMNLGCYYPLKNRCEIDACIGPNSNDPRRTFTLWHEVGGHGILQGGWFRSEYHRLGHYDPLVTTEITITPEATEVIEKQANLFAAHAAAPACLIDCAIRYTFNMIRPTLPYYKPCRYCLDGVEYYVDSFEDLCRVIARRIQPLFGGLSVEALSYRVKRSKLVLDRSRSQVALLRVAS